MELLKKLTQINSVSGNEENIHSAIIDEIGSCVDEYYTDNMNNLVVHKKGVGKKILITAHTDEIGLMAVYIDDSGFVRFSAVGNIDAKILHNHRVMFPNGTIGSVQCESGVDISKDFTIKNMYIDIGVSDKSDAQMLVSPGDVASFCGEFYKPGKKIISKALDNRAGVYALIQAIKRISDCDNDLYFVFTSQKELGLRGAKTAAYNIEPDVSVCIDATPADDVPSNDLMQIKLGDGVAVKIMDKSVITNKKFRDNIVRIARDNEIKIQYEIQNSITTDSYALQITGKGSVTGALSIPVRYIHSGNEMAHEDDITSCVDLICEICKKDFILF